MNAKNSNLNRLASELKTAHVGTARVRINCLRCEQTTVTDPEQVKDLVQKFKLEGCHRLHRCNRVPVLISQQELYDVLTYNDRPESNLLVFPPFLLETNTHFTYLRGQGLHRLAAASHVLAGDDCWWGVDFYLREALTDPVLNFIREDLDNARPPKDGLIYCKIAHYRHLRDRYSVGKWLARLSKVKRRDLKQLRTQKLAQPIRESLDNLLDLQPLLADFQIGTSHRFLPLRCPKEFSHYLNHILTTWTQILGEAFPYLDHNTVTKLAGRCPFYSRSDSDFIRQAVATKQIFSLVPDHLKTDVLQRTLNARVMIPTIKTFLEDVKWFEPAARVLQSLVPRRGTLRQSWFRCWDVPIEVREQYSDGSMRSVDRFPAARFWSAYVQMFCAAYRYFPSISDFSPRKDQKGHAQYNYLPASAECWWRLARLAKDLGFSSSKIEDLLLRTQTQYLADDLLSQARPTAIYTFQPEQRQNNVHQIDGILSTVQSTSVRPDSIEMTSDVYQKFDFRKRCGRTFERPFRNDIHYIYLCNIYWDHVATTQRSDITSFFVVRNTFKAFFGEPPPHDLDEDGSSDVSDDDIGITDDGSIEQYDLLDLDDAVMNDFMPDFVDVTQAEEVNNTLPTLPLLHTPESLALESSASITSSHAVYPDLRPTPAQELVVQHQRPSFLQSNIIQNPDLGPVDRQSLPFISPSEVFNHPDRGLPPANDMSSSMVERDSFPGAMLALPPPSLPTPVPASIPTPPLLPPPPPPPPAPALQLPADDTSSSMVERDSFPGAALDVPQPSTMELQQPFRFSIVTAGNVEHRSDDHDRASFPDAIEDSNFNFAEAAETPSVFAGLLFSQPASPNERITPARASTTDPGRNVPIQDSGSPTYEAVNMQISESRIFEAELEAEPNSVILTPNPPKRKLIADMSNACVSCDQDYLILDFNADILSIDAFCRGYRSLEGQGCIIRAKNPTLWRAIFFRRTSRGKKLMKDLLLLANSPLAKVTARGILSLGLRVATAMIDNPGEKDIIVICSSHQPFKNYLEQTQGNINFTPPHWNGAHWEVDLQLVGHDYIPPEDDDHYKKKQAIEELDD